MHLAKLLLSVGLLAMAGCRGTWAVEADPLAGPYRVSGVVRTEEGTSLIRLQDGRTLPTRLAEVRYLGQIDSAGHAPWLILGGRPCTDCDANLGIYFHSPSRGGMEAGEKETRYLYPGVVEEWDPEVPGDTIDSRARFFVGECLPSVGAKAIWFQETRTAPAVLERRVVLIVVTEGKLEMAELALSASESEREFTGLDEVLENVRGGGCREIPGIRQSREP